MTPTETGLLCALVGVLSGMCGVIVGGLTKVSRAVCILKHENLKELLHERFNSLHKSIKRIEEKLDRLNGEEKD